MLFLTIWVALAFFVAGEAGKGPLATEGRPPQWARPVFIAGAVLAIVHAAIAFAIRYGWDHELAVTATAAQSAQIYGFAWRGSIYVNYAFLALWLLLAWSFVFTGFLIAVWGYGVAFPVLATIIAASAVTFALMPRPAASAA